MGSKLTPIEARVLSLRSSGLSLKEVAEMMGWKGKERVRQVEARVERKVRFGKNLKQQEVCKGS